MFFGTLGWQFDSPNGGRQDWFRKNDRLDRGGQRLILRRGYCFADWVQRRDFFGNSRFRCPITLLWRGRDGFIFNSHWRRLHWFRSVGRRFDHHRFQFRLYRSDGNVEIDDFPIGGKGRTLKYRTACAWLWHPRHFLSVQSVLYQDDFFFRQACQRRTFPLDTKLLYSIEDFLAIDIELFRQCVDSDGQTKTLLERTAKRTRNKKIGTLRPLPILP